MEIAHTDFTAGLRTKNITVAPMPAVVEFANPPKELLDAIKKDKLIVQNIGAAVFKQLHESQLKIQDAIQDFDEKFKPSGEKEVDEAEIRKFQSACAQICLAQKGLAETVAQKKWQEFVARDKAWTKYQIKFACKVASVTLGLSLSIATAAVTGGTTALAVIGMASKVYTLGKEIYEFAKDVSTVEKTIVTLAAALAQRYGNPQLQALDWKAQAQEIAASLGAPFAKGTSTLTEYLAQHEAKLGQLGSKAESAYDSAKDMMQKITELEKQTKGTAKEKKVKDLGTRADAFLEKVASLNAKVEEGETFNAAMTAMNEQFIAKRDPKIAPLKKAVDYASAANELIGLTKEIVDFAQALA